MFRQLRILNPVIFATIKSRANRNTFVYRGFARSTSKKPIQSSSIQSTGQIQPPPPQAEEDPWIPVTDKASGQIYYWNTKTDETTAIGEPKPNMATPAPQQGGSMMGGLGQVVAEGFAFGVGSSIARSVVGSMFGGFGGGGGSDDSDTDGII
mmetsp:Transcript_10462/g.10530  ORF Transcript_10462/g.10530 Transcript_10462/m.10530 type:complete len:152 (-) Transcript_10462:192-647(-)|eukprot:CAMPEP_0182428332 /NCGR_PEP_ID=MMETSP1167-20130531/22384_1 /TAXON_ID=2988 /ORGANISM="Mallomonas Sp, Strain CCMP3275" /LENGTH=151 /DNA_ID=CAMNT_0024611167 /DNA_START=98 /DNA_END=553 /DNA_ORIENTATION=+